MNFAALAGIGAGLAAFWSSIRAWLDILLSVVWVSAVVEHPASTYLLAYLDAHYRRSLLGVPILGSIQEYVRPHRRREWIGVRRPGVREVFWNGLGFLVLSAGQNQQNKADYSYILRVGHFRGAFDVERLLLLALEKVNERAETGKRSDRYYVRRHYGMARYARGDGLPQAGGISGGSREPQSPESDHTHRMRPLGWTQDDLGEPNEKTPFRGLVFGEEVENLQRRLETWYKAEAFYRERMIPWRMGALLYGPPGTGKTSFARAIAQQFGIPIHVIDLSGMDNRELWEAWRQAVGDAPCVALIEDIDRVFHGSTNIVPDARLTLDVLLNCISGVEVSDGVLTLVTANDVAHVDPALGVHGGNGVSSRPGRLDTAVRFGEMDQDGKVRLVLQIVGHVARPTRGPDDHDPMGQLDKLQDMLWREVVTNAALTTPAQVQARCAEIALARLYRQVTS